MTGQWIRRSSRRLDFEAGGVRLGLVYGSTLAIPKWTAVVDNRIVGLFSDEETARRAVEDAFRSRRRPERRLLDEDWLVGG